MGCGLGALALALLQTAPPAVDVPPDGLARVLAYFETLARPDGGYGFGCEPTSHITATWAAVGAYRMLGRMPPHPDAIAEFVRTHHPYRGPHAESKPHAAELRSFTVQRIQTLKWLGQDASMFLDEVRGWRKPTTYAAMYERKGYPLFQQETLAFVGRDLLGLPVSDIDPALVEYVVSRRRTDGSFNNTPASDGSDGHVVNTWRGVQVLRLLGRLDEKRAETVTWLRGLQHGCGVFSRSNPDDMSFCLDNTQAAVLALEALGAEPEGRKACIRWICTLWNPDGGFGNKQGFVSDPVSTFQALETLHALGAQNDLAQYRRELRAPEPGPPDGLKPWTIQIQAPGQGSPEDAVTLARDLRIHLWGAKNAPPGWIERAQAVARRRDVPVTFFTANEEYGTYVGLVGQGTYSHVSDPIAPAGADMGPSMAGKDPSWDDFVVKRIGVLRKAGGRMVWQICDNVEFSNILLDAPSGYDAVATFHMRQNFADLLPFIYRCGKPFVALQDAHGPEAWWWADDLAGYRTVFLAKEPTWAGWIEALGANRVVAVRHDAVTRFRTRMLGTGPWWVREAVRRDEAAWRWWGDTPEDIRRPLVSVVAVKPGDAFEAGSPAKGVAIRVRTAWTHSAQGVPVEPIAELVSLDVDGARIATRRVETKGTRGRREDVYDLATREDLRPGSHVARVTVRVLGDATERRVDMPFELP